jgi:hypothetical protein
MLMTYYSPNGNRDRTPTKCARKGCDQVMMKRTLEDHDGLCPTHYYEGWGDSHPLTTPLLDADALAALKGGD